MTRSESGVRSWFDKLTTSGSSEPARPEPVEGRRVITALGRAGTVAVLLLAGMRPAWASPPVADPNAGSSKPTVDTAPNGKPVIQITDPSAGGVSTNKYLQFNVDPGGLILNNGTGISNTQLAGYIAANPNLSRSASVILNEV